jgi:hypothetical protein
MSSRCSICKHPKRDSIDVSLRRDGTRSTAREFQVSLPSLHRHKRHLTVSVESQTGATPDQGAEASARPSGTHSSLAELDVLMRHCEQTLIQAKSSKNLSHITRALKEVRACLELKVKLETEKPRNVSSASSGHQGRKLGDAEISIRVLQKICWYTRGFHPLKIWQLKTLHDTVMDLAQSNLTPDEIAQQMTLRTPGGSDLSLMERLFGLLWKEEWLGQEREVAVLIIQNMWEGLKGYPGILEHIDGALAQPLGEPVVPRQGTFARHLVGKLSGPGVLNSPYCGPP